MGNEAIKEIGAACQVSSSRPLQAIAAFPKKKFFSRMVGRHFANRGPFQRVMLHRTCHLVQACCISKRYLSSSPSVASMIRKNCKLSADNGSRNSNDPIWLTPLKRPSGFASSSANLQITPVASCLALTYRRWSNGCLHPKSWRAPRRRKYSPWSTGHGPIVAGKLASVVAIACGFAFDVPMKDSRPILIGTSNAPHYRIRVADFISRRSS